MTENATKKSSLSAKELQVCDIFCDKYAFEIPSYQRPYSWTPVEASELVSDLQEHIKHQSNTPLNPYFLGSIVLIKGDSAESQVIDGQQRLTTLTILFSVLRHLIEDKDTKDEIMDKLVQKGKKLQKIENKYRILLRSRDREFFRENIQKEKGIKKLFDSTAELKDSQKNIRENAICIHELLKCKSQDDLTKLAEFIVTDCYLVVVTTPDTDSAYRIFSVMNTRGLDLTATDILKSKIIGAIPDTERQNYTAKWENIEESIGRERFGQLFSHIRMIYRRSKSQGTLIKEFDEHVKPRENPTDFISNILLPYSEAYENIINASFTSEKNAEKINNVFSWLNIVDNFDWLPPAIYYFAQNRNDTDRLLDFFKKLERLASCMMIFRANINERIKRYSEILSWISDKKDVLSPDSPMMLTDEEIDKTLLALDGHVYENSRTRLMILLRLDSVLSGGEAEYKHGIITIEHVLPQNPDSSSQWIEWIPDEEERNNLVHRLGNLVLLSRSKNSSAKNYEFEHKKNSYFTGGYSSFAITTGVINEPRWDADTILKKQEEYINKLSEEWKLNKRNTGNT